MNDEYKNLLLAMARIMGSIRSYPISNYEDYEVIHEFLLEKSKQEEGE